MANVKPTRKLIAEAIAHHKDFQLRLPSSGQTVRPNYDFNPHLLTIGTVVGVMSSWDGNGGSWVEIGQIAKESFDDKKGATYEIVVLPRLTDVSSLYTIAYPAERVSCVFESIDDKKEKEGKPYIFPKTEPRLG